VDHGRGLKVPQERQIPLALSSGEIAAVYDFTIDPQQVSSRSLMIARIPK
jgi:hypothetical protein